MSETGIEATEGYAKTKAEKRIESGVQFLLFVLVYAFAAVVLVMDIFFWRA